MLAKGKMCSKATAKIWLVVVNLLFFLLGAAALSIGVFVLIDKSQLTNLLRLAGASSITDALNVPSLLESSAYVFIVAGGVILLIGILGCCGAVKEVKTFLIIYAVIVSLVLALQIAAVVVAYFFRGQIESTFQSFLNQTIAEKYEGLQSNNGQITSESSEPFSIGWDFAHITMECCGNSNFTDFVDYATQWVRSYNISGVTVQAQVPVSCCKFMDKSKFPTKLSELQFVDINGCLLTPNSTNANLEGCYGKVSAQATAYAWYILGVGIGIVVFELLCVTAAIVVIKGIAKDKVVPVA